MKLIQGLLAARRMTGAKMPEPVFLQGVGRWRRRFEEALLREFATQTEMVVY
jgi:hypothetical protein